MNLKPIKEVIRGIGMKEDLTSPCIASGGTVITASCLTTHTIPQGILVMCYRCLYNPAGGHFGVPSFDLESFFC